VKTSQSFWERKFDLNSIEIIHAGIAAPTGNNRNFLVNPYEMKSIAMQDEVASNLVNSWLPRDNTSQNSTEQKQD
jgi:hypothetical protein